MLSTSPLYIYVCMYVLLFYIKRWIEKHESMPLYVCCGRCGEVVQHFVFLSWYKAQWNKNIFNEKLLFIILWLTEWDWYCDRSWKERDKKSSCFYLF